MEKLKISQTENKINLTDLLILDNQNSNIETFINLEKPSKTFCRIISYLELKDIYSLKLVCKSLSNGIDNKVVKEYFKNIFLKNGDKLHKLRDVLWNKLLGLEKFKEESYFEYIGNIREQNLYKNILMEVNKIQKTGKSVITEAAGLKRITSSFDDISRDVGRTFHNERFHKGILEGELTRVLGALSYFKREVGYCQGMNFIAGALICLSDSEEQAFWIFLVFLSQYELKNMFIRNMPDYAVRVYQLNYYVQKYLPEIFYHFKKNKIPFDMLYSKWLITIFAQYLPFEHLNLVWTLFILDRWKAIIKFALIYLSDLQEHLIKLDIEGVSQFFRHDYLQFHSDQVKTFYLYSNSKGKFKVTNKELRKLRESYYIDLAKDKLNDQDSKWEKDQLQHLEKYINEKTKIEQIFKKDISNYKSAIEEIDKRYSASYKIYNNHLIICKNIKKKLEVLVDDKNIFENIIDNLKREMNNINLINSMNKIKGTSLNYGFNSDQGNRKKIILEQEMGKINKKLESVNEDVRKVNMVLLENYHILEEKKYTMDQIRKEKIKKKFMMEKYMILSEKKEDELIRNLSEKLKLSENFLQNFQF